MKPPVMLATVYRRAAKVIRERGWCKHTLQNEKGAVCARGAINLVVNGDVAQFPWPETSENFLANAIGLRSGGGLSPLSVALVAWNNSRRRTKAQVLAALKRAERKAAREKARVRP